MKKFKKLSAIVLVLIMVVGTMGGCNKLKKPSEMLDTMATKMKEADSIEADATTDLDMKLGEKELKMNVVVTETILEKHKKAKVAMNVKTVNKEADNSMTMYYEKNKKNGKDVYMSYANMNKNWYKQEIQLKDYDSEIEGYKSKVGIDRYLPSKDTFKKTGKEKIGKISTVIIEGTVTGEAMNSILDSEETVSQFKKMLGDKTGIKDTDTLPVKIWVDKKTTLPVKVSIDLSKIMTTLMENVQTFITGKDGKGSVTMNKYIMEVNYKKIGNVKDFKIPDEAINAK